MYYKYTSIQLLHTYEIYAMPLCIHINIKLHTYSKDTMTLTTIAKCIILVVTVADHSVVNYNLYSILNTYFYL